MNQILTIGTCALQDAVHAVSILTVGVEECIVPQYVTRQLGKTQIFLGSHCVVEKEQEKACKCKAFAEEIQSEDPQTRSFQGNEEVNKTRQWRVFSNAGDEGIEPPLEVLETSVLPLN